MNFEESMIILNQKEAEYKKAVAETALLLPDQVKSIMQKIIELNPKLSEVYWTQYTPWFNDGESCEFGVNSIEAYGEDGDDYYYDSDIIGFEELDSIIHSNEDLLLEAFGDHSKISYQDGELSVSRYSHD